VFGLQPPPSPPDPESTKTAPPHITLNGIVTLGGKHALVTLPPAPGKTGVEAQPRALVLAEGQREGDLEVLEIDGTAGTVTVNNAGTIATLNFKENGAQPMSARQVGLAPAMPFLGDPGQSPDAQVGPLGLSPEARARLFTVRGRGSQRTPRITAASLPDSVPSQSQFGQSAPNASSASR
jgi:hypothetical protein